MKGRRWKAAGLCYGLLGMVLVSACAAPATEVEPTAEAPTIPVVAKPTPARAGRPLVEVKRASIAEVVKLDGKLVAQEEVRLTYPGKASVGDILVKPGQAVKQGDILAEIVAPGRGWAVDVANSLNIAQARLQAAEVRLVDARGQAESRAAAAARQASSNEQRHKQAVDDANAVLRRAQDNLKIVQAGAPVVERQLAQNGVTAAQAAVAKAVSDQEILAAGPDESAVRAAQRQVSARQIELAKVRADLDKLLRGPDPAAVREADAAIQRVETELQITRTTKLDPLVDPTVARKRQEVAIQEGQLALQQAQARLAALKQPPSDLDVRVARQQVQDAEQAVASAEASVSTLMEGPNEAAFQAAADGVARAQLAVDTAQAHAREVNGRPTQFELADAQEQVRNAQAALETVVRTPIDAVMPPDVEIAAAEQAVAQANQEVANLQELLEASHVRAPFDGTVVSVPVQAGAVLGPETVLAIIARPGPALVRVEVADDQIGLLTVGQSASVRLERGDLAGSPLTGTVAALSPAVRATGGVRVASVDLAVNWPAGRAPQFGTPALVDVIIQEKQDVLVLPMSAVRQVGNRATVQIVEGSRRRNVNVELGIRNDEDVEIVSGLNEGQSVSAGTAT